MANLAPMTVSANGQHIATGLPSQHSGFSQNLQGGLLEGAAAKTAAKTAAQANHAITAGVSMRGGSYTEYHPSQVAEGNTIKGVSANANTGNLLKNLNSLRTAATYDHLGNATPYKVGGKRRRKTNGRSHRRNHKRSRRKSSHRIRRRSKHATKRR